MNTRDNLANKLANVNSVTQGRTFGLVPSDQFFWVAKQKTSIQTLWAESWGCDVFGDRWVKLTTSLKKTAFHEAKKILSDENLFEYKQYTELVDGKRVSIWLVKNMQGSKTHLPDTQPKRLFSQHRVRYHKFLKSDYWLETRELVLARDNHTCTSCGSCKSLQVHHLTYEHHRNEKEHLADLITLCKSCHKKEHT